MSEHKSVSQADIQCLLEGSAPCSDAGIAAVTVGTERLSAFLRDQYLKDYIPQGGSKLKFVCGRQGAGKTHFARQMMIEAKKLSYRVVHFSAANLSMHDFREVYLEILRQCDIDCVLQGCAREAVRRMGYDPDTIRAGMKYVDMLAEQGEADGLTLRSVRDCLRKMFIRNARLDNSFAYCLSLLTGDILGHPVLEPQNRELLKRYLLGDKNVKMSQLRPLGFTPEKISKFNARHMLRSLAEVVHIAGYSGILVVIDDLDALIHTASADNSVKYTPARRQDAYESLRQLIDDIDNMRYILFVLCLDRELLDNEAQGIKSYSALWMRIQNEVIGKRFNSFADILDLDRLADEELTSEALVSMSEKLSMVLMENGMQAYPIDLPMADALRDRACYGGIGLPYMVNRQTLTPPAALLENSPADEDIPDFGKDATETGEFENDRF